MVTYKVLATPFYNGPSCIFAVGGQSCTRFLVIDTWAGVGQPREIPGYDIHQHRDGSITVAVPALVDSKISMAEQQELCDQMLNQIEDAFGFDVGTCSSSEYRTGFLAQLWDVFLDTDDQKFIARALTES